MNYKFYIGTTEVFPINGNNVSIEYNKNKFGGIVFDVEVKTPFLFNYHDPIFDFSTKDICAEYTFSIEQICNGTPAVIWEGIFHVAEATIDESKCTIEIEMTKRDTMLYPEVLCNILDIPDSVQVESGSGPSLRIYSHGKRLSDVLLFLAKRSNPKIVGVISDLFQINQLNSPGTPTGVTNEWDRLVCFSLSDIQEPIPSNLATIEQVTFAQFMADLSVLFDAYWFIDSNYNLRVEHSTFFAGAVGIDLTQPEYEKYLSGNNKYSYDIKNVYKSEEWKIADNDYKTALIYTGLPDITEDSKSKSYSTNVIRTDFEKIRVYAQNSTNDGIFMFATNSSDQVISSFAHGSNYPLKPHVLIMNFHLWNRPALQAIINIQNKRTGELRSGGIVTLDTVPVKLQEEIKFPICCNTINPTQIIKTPLGDGFLEKGKVDLKTGMATISVKYKISPCADVTPVTIGDCDLWLKHNTGISVSGGKVTSWADSSGNSRNAVSAVPTEPDFLTGGFVKFTGGQQLVTPAFTWFPGKRGTVFILLSRVGIVAPTAMVLLSNYDGGAGNFFDIILDGAGEYFTVTEGGTFPTSSIPYLDRWGLFVLRRNSDQTVTCRFNSVECLANPMSITNAQWSNKPLVIGHNSNVPFVGAGGAIAEVGEIICFSRDLELHEVEQIETNMIKRAIYNNIYPLG